MPKKTNYHVVQIAKAFEPLLQENKRIKFYYGGRAGGKSYAFADSLLLKGRQKKLLIACLREIQDSIKDSVYKLLCDRIALYELNDYKILDQILYAKGCSGRYLCEKLGNSGAQVIESLEKLLDAKMIYRKNGVWRNYNLEKIYSIKKLISVEAKLGNIKKVREQTIANTWFASQSYALISTKNPRPKTIETFQKSGIGLYCKDYINRK